MGLESGGRMQTKALGAWMFAGLTAGAAMLGARSSKPGLWYRTLRKAKANPPPVVFGPVWTALYSGIAYSGYRVWRAPASRERTTALALWAGQMALNGAWSPTFFAAHRPKAALGIISALVPTIALYARAANRVDPRASKAVWPYLAWTSFATYLNAAVVTKNPLRV